MMCLLHTKSEGRSYCCYTTMSVDELRLLSLTSSHNRRAESLWGRMGGGDWHVIAMHLLSVKKSRVKTKDISSALLLWDSGVLATPGGLSCCFLNLP